MAPKYKFTYFNLKGLGESCRFLFLYGNIPFEDNRVEPADWPKVKPTLKYGLLPILEIDGKEYMQSTCISRYLGKQLNLTGSNDVENLEIDAMVENFIDFKLFAKEWSKKSPEERNKTRDEFFKNTVHLYFTRFEECVKANNGYLACGKLTWADFYVAGAMDYVLFMIGTDVTAQYPQFQKLLEKIYALPAIKSWIAKRPVNIF